MAREEPMEHVPVFEKLGEEQTRLQFSNMNNDIGAQARTWLHGIEQAREKARHAELLAEIRKPHWSITPGFVVGVVAMVAACIAAYYAYLAYAQPQQSAPVAAQPTQTTQPVSSTPPGSQPPPERSQQEQPRK